MYSRETGFSSYPSAKELQERYYQKTLRSQKSPFKQPESPQQPEKPDKPELEKIFSGMKGDDVLILALLCFLLLSDGDKSNIDLVLAAALLFIEFG